MNKRMRELLAQIQSMTLQAKAFMEGENKDVAKANEIMDKVDELRKEYEAEERMFNAEKLASSQAATVKVTDPAGEPEKKTVEVDAIAKFGQDAKNGFKLDKTMNEGSNTDGGYAVPEDVVTKIEEYRGSKRSLRDLVRTVPVKTKSGKRAFKKRSQQTGFVKVGEGNKISAKATPQFETVEYNIDKYAGYFPVTNEVLDDTDSNLGEILIEWIGDESRVTGNKLILEQIATKPAVEIKGLDGIKEILNVKLGSAFKATSKIITNDDGLQYLDTLKDATGRSLLAPVPGEPMKMVLPAGHVNVPVEVYPNTDMPTTEKKIPFVIGDLKEGIIFWDRKQMNIKISDVAVVGDLNAYEEDLTLYRAIEREDVTLRDEAAFVNGYIPMGE